MTGPGKDYISGGGGGWQNSRPGREAYARTTLPLRRQREHTRSRRMDPLTRARTGWRFGAQMRRVCRLEWLTRLPVAGPFPQTSQRRAITSASFGHNTVYSNTGRRGRQACPHFRHHPAKEAG